MLQKATLAGLALLVVILGAALLGRPTTASVDRAPSRELRDVIASLSGNSERLDRLEQRTAKLPGIDSSARRPSIPRAPAAPEDRAEVNGENDPESERADARANADRRMLAIEEHLATEEVDPAWAPEARRIIETAAGSPQLEGSRVDAIVCKTTLCRIEVQHESERAAEVWSSVFYGEAVALPRGFQRRLPPQGGVERTVVYLAREGHRIPRASQEAQ